jgi:hypothetical protein
MPDKDELLERVRERFKAIDTSSVLGWELACEEIAAFVREQIQQAVEKEREECGRPLKVMYKSGYQDSWSSAEMEQLAEQVLAKNTLINRVLKEYAEEKRYTDWVPLDPALVTLANCVVNIATAIRARGEADARHSRSLRRPYEDLSYRLKSGIL